MSYKKTDLPPFAPVTSDLPAKPQHHLTGTAPAQPEGGATKQRTRAPSQTNVCQLCRKQTHEGERRVVAVTRVASPRFLNGDG